MEKVNSFQRKLGIALGSIVVVGVAVVTFTYEKMSSAANVAQAPSGTVASTPAITTTAGQSSQNNAGVTAAAVPSSSPAPVSSAPAASTPPPAIVPKQTASVYKDGTYTATGSYMSPGGEEQVKVTLTLANDVIASASVTPMASDRTSQRYQDKFISGYKQYVVGQKIASVNLTYVSGSSLTPKGFDDALAQIMTQAKA